MTQRVEFEGSQKAKLSARLDVPSGNVLGYAIFAHCFTCSKDLHATKRIAGELSRQGIAVLRFDFTGLGSSEGEFASTNFSSNREDLLIAAQYLRDHYQAPSLLIGHSLGGAAVLSIAAEVPELKAIVTIGAPSEAEHVAKNFGAKIDEISEKGQAKVSLAGRDFFIRKQFLDDLKANDVLEKVAALRKPLLILHSPIDQIVGVENATNIFVAAKHPKSFVSLDDADHLISKDEHAEFAASVISAWSMKYLENPQNEETITHENITKVVETGNGKFQNLVHSGGHHTLADEPKSVGGLNSGMSPYDFLAASLGSCTSMTLRMYANFKKLDIGRITVDVSHSKIHAKDCEDCATQTQEDGGKIDIFERHIHVDGLTDRDLKTKLVEIADKCPVHKTLQREAVVKTEYLEK